MKVKVCLDEPSQRLNLNDEYTVYGIVTVKKVYEEQTFYKIFYILSQNNFFASATYRDSKYFKIIDGTLPPSWRFTQYSGENIELDTTHYGFTNVLGFKEMVEDRTFAHKLWYDAAEPEYEIFAKRKAEIDAELGYMD
jgi:hypothetical protein